MEQMFRPLSAKLENFILQYTESYQIEGVYQYCVHIYVGMWSVTEHSGVAYYTLLVGRNV